LLREDFLLNSEMLDLSKNIKFDPRGIYPAVALNIFIGYVRKKWKKFEKDPIAPKSTPGEQILWPMIGYVNLSAPLPIFGSLENERTDL
jgi:hypothetical protein